MLFSNALRKTFKVQSGSHALFLEPKIQHWHSYDNNYAADLGWDTSRKYGFSVSERVAEPRHQKHDSTGYLMLPKLKEFLCCH